MCPPSWHWDHFYKGNLANSSHLKAYCRYDTKYHLDLLEHDKKAAFDAGSIDMMRTKDVLLPEGVLTASVTYPTTHLK
jgi:hypothetical protein